MKQYSLSKDDKYVELDVTEIKVTKDDIFIKTLSNCSLELAQWKIRCLFNCFNLSPASENYVRYSDRAIFINKLWFDENNFKIVR